MLYWIRYPCIRIAIFFAAGILFSHSVSVPVLLKCFLLLLSVISFSRFLVRSGKSTFYRFNVMVSLLAFSCLFLLGSLCHQTANPFNRKNHLIHAAQDYACYIVRITDAVDSSGHYLKFPVNVVRIYARGHWRAVEGKILVYLQKPAKVDYHDLLLIKGRPESIPPPLNPDEFHYQRFMKHKGVAFRHFIKPGEFIHLGEKKSFSIYGASLKARRRMTSIITSQFEGPGARGILLALLTGQRQYIDPDTYNSFIETGIVHTLAVSGLHVGMIYMFLLILLKPFHRNRWSRKISYLLKIVVLVFFAFLTGLSPSVLRATLMFSIMALGKILVRESPSLNSVFLSAFVLMGINPYLLFDVGFQLSYTAVTGIILFQPLIYPLIRTKYFLLDWVWKLSSVSIAAQGFTLPLTLIYFKQFPSYFLLGNIIAIPLVSLLIIGGILLVSVSFMPKVAGLLALLLHQISQIFLKMISWIQSLPYSLIQPIHIDVSQGALLFLSTLTLFISFQQRKAWPLIMASICLSAMFMIDVHHYFHARNERKLIVYHVPGTSCVELVGRSTGIMIVGKLPEGQPSAVDYHTRNHIIRGRRKTKKYSRSSISARVPSINLEGLTLLNWNGKTIGLLYDKFEMERLRSISLDYLIVSHDALNPSDMKTGDLRIKQVVWDSSCRKNPFPTTLTAEQEDQSGEAFIHPVRHPVSRDETYSVKENNGLAHHVGIQGPFIDHLKDQE